MFSLLVLLGKARCVQCFAFSAEFFEPFQQIASQGNGPAFVLTMGQSIQPEDVKNFRASKFSHALCLHTVLVSKYPYGGPIIEVQCCTLSQNDLRFLIGTRLFLC